MSIRNIILIDALDLEFGPGLGALTGETGAGKSILLDSLGLALGERAGGELIRTGEKQGSVTASFALEDGHPALLWASERDIPVDDNTLILRRTLSHEERGKALVNDQPVSQAALRELGALLIEIQGQFDDRGLMNSRHHLLLLDQFGELEAEAAELRRLFREHQSAQKALREAEAQLRDAQADADYLAHSLAELAELAPEEGEEEALDIRRRQMQASEKVMGDIARAAELLGMRGAEQMVLDAQRRVDDAALKTEGLLDAAQEALGQAVNELALAAQEVDLALERMQFDPAELEATEARLFALRGLARKHQITVEQLPGLHKTIAAKLEMIQEGKARIDDLKASFAVAEAAFQKYAAMLSKKRKKAARALDKAVAVELVPLKLERAVFRTHLQTEAGRVAGDGLDSVSFEVATNPGAPPGPISKIASGGELSRFLLALKVCLARRQEGKTMIFDEIDRGVGGATADAIGQRLQRLGGVGQTLVITHSPQVAARAKRQWRIEKAVIGSGVNERTLTSVTEIEDKDRVDEVARMLAGETLTEEARDAARSLLDLARGA